MKPLSYWIDRGAEVCGSQNKLAARIGTDKGSLSKMKSGQTSMPKAVAQALGEVCGVDGEALYEAQRVSRRRASVERQARSLGLLQVCIVVAGAAMVAGLDLGQVWSYPVDLAGLFASGWLADETNHYRGLVGVACALIMGLASRHRGATASRR